MDTEYVDHNGIEEQADLEIAKVTAEPKSDWAPNPAAFHLTWTFLVC
jgi:hypothetical protein